MSIKLSPIIKPAELTWLNQDEEIVIIDASAGSKERYDEQHLAGALFADVNNDLANIVDFAVGGRHPLPTLEQFTLVLQRFGITKDTHVIVYDDKNGGNAAARLWWMLKAIGHEKVQVIDGAFKRPLKPVSQQQIKLKFQRLLKNTKSQPGTYPYPI
ncbi:sulfurtransferase [Pedobacter sp. HDW13]|uniref:sulfurtransferase n=1 Tax=Pedobacter sp. HDW13 TaxID=2714940 RepID=UPI001F0FBA9D|nr:rhodanese-like domain-containing protein [Pedobacter sp. HDW13]